jgi:hypothetical protein
VWHAAPGAQDLGAVGGRRGRTRRPASPAPARPRAARGEGAAADPRGAPQTARHSARLDPGPAGPAYTGVKGRALTGARELRSKGSAPPWGGRRPPARGAREPSARAPRGQGRAPDSSPRFTKVEPPAARERPGEGGRSQPGGWREPREGWAPAPWRPRQAPSRPSCTQRAAAAHQSDLPRARPPLRRRARCTFRPGGRALWLGYTRSDGRPVARRLKGVRKTTTVATAQGATKIPHLQRAARGGGRPRALGRRKPREGPPCRGVGPRRAYAPARRLKTAGDSAAAIRSIAAASVSRDAA